MTFNDKTIKENRISMNEWMVDDNLVTHMSMIRQKKISNDVKSYNPSKTFKVLDTIFISGEKMVLWLHSNILYRIFIEIVEKWSEDNT